MNGRSGQLLGLILLALFILSCNLSTIAAVTPTPTEIIPPTPENTATRALPPTFAPPAIVFTPTNNPPTLTDTPANTPTLDLPTETSTSTLIPYDPNATPTPPPTIPSGYHTAVPRVNPSKTPTGPAPTARSSASAFAIQFTPSIDGDWSEWPNAETAAGYVVFGGSNWVNANDLNASYKTAYDGNYLYIAVKVIDDIYAQNSTGYKIYLGDSLEILVDANLDGDYYSKGLSTDDFQLGISPGKGSLSGAKEAYLWYPVNLRGARPQVVSASQVISGGYLVEAAIPWSTFSISPVSGQHLGFAVSVSDNDNPSQEIQESMVSSVSTRRFLNPTTWGDLTLQ
jgi:hypothetical protein